MGRRDSLLSPTRLIALYLSCSLTLERTPAPLLQALDVSARVVLSDGGDEPETVLANLRENVEANFPFADAANSCVKVDVQRLDWRDYLPSSPLANSHLQEERYDLLLGTDLAYERGQATLLHSAVAGLLRFPSPSFDELKPVFWLTIALRPTHVAEIAEVHSLFPSSSSPFDPSLLRHHAGKLYRLISIASQELVGPDGFAGRATQVRRPFGSTLCADLAAAGDEEDSVDEDADAGEENEAVDFEVFLDWTALSLNLAVYAESDEEEPQGTMLQDCFATSSDSVPVGSSPTLQAYETAA
ncbi:hypothetical protein JCM10021v2_006641 [Rhodotorula toruloides]